MKSALKLPIYSICIYFLLLFIKLGRQKHTIVRLLLNSLRDKRLLVHMLVLHTKPIPIAANGKTEIHSVVCHGDVTQYIACLKTLLYFSALGIPVVVHDDRSLTDDDKHVLTKHFPGIRILDFAYSTRELLPLLKKYPALRKERLDTPWNLFHILIMLDVPYFAKSQKIIYLDSDILFFNRPKQLIQWITSDENTHETMYMHDHMDAHSLSEIMFKTFYRKKMIPKFNTGLRCFWKRSFDPAGMNKFLNIMGVLNYKVYWRDQTYAMIDTLLHYKKSTKFDGSYVVSLKPSVTTTTTCIHYITPVRNQLFTDFIDLLIYRIPDIFS